jgi:hypothetical protein
MGGRPVTTGSQAQRERQARYRARLAAAALPEADDLDRAVMHEVRALAASVARKPSETDAGFQLVRRIIRGAHRRLSDAGYDRTEAGRRLLIRLETVAPITPVKRNDSSEN